MPQDLPRHLIVPDRVDEGFGPFRHVFQLVLCVHQLLPLFFESCQRSIDGGFVRGLHPLGEGEPRLRFRPGRILRQRLFHAPHLPALFPYHFQKILHIIHRQPPRTNSPTAAIIASCPFFFVAKARITASSIVPLAIR